MSPRNFYELLRNRDEGCFTRSGLKITKDDLLLGTMKRCVGLPVLIGVAFIFVVNVGVFLNIPGFSIRDGIIGTEFASGFLYAVGIDNQVMIVVSAIFFGYGALVGMACNLVAWTLEKWIK